MKVIQSAVLMQQLHFPATCFAQESTTLVYTVAMSLYHTISW